MMSDSRAAKKQDKDKNTDDDEEKSIVEPIADTEMPLELRQKFQRLIQQVPTVGAARTSKESRTEAARQVFQQIQDLVSEHPILARVVLSKGYSLLTAVCRHTAIRDVGHDVIKCLITMNPNALLWCSWTIGNKVCPLQDIARNPCHCVLLPWIAQRHAFVFDHATVLKNPPHYDLVRNYADGQCSASVVRSFYELYPQGLQQEDACSQIPSPLHECLRGREECDAGLFEWMAEQYPQAISFKAKFGVTLLYQACSVISSTVYGNRSSSLCNENKARICRFLMEKYPEAVRTPGEDGRGLPLHRLARRCNRPLAQDLVIAQLRLYPDAVQIRDDSIPDKLTEVPFIQQIQPLLQREARIQEEAAWLSKACTDLRDISTSISSSTGMTASSYSYSLTAGQHEANVVHEANPFHAVSIIFTSWATDSLAVQFPAMEAEIQREIDRVKCEFEWEDMPDGSHTDDDDGDDYFYVMDDFFQDSFQDDSDY